MSPTTTVNTSALDALEAADLDDDASHRAYRRRIVETALRASNATLNPVGDVRITIVHEGQSVTLYRDDLGSIAVTTVA